MIINATNNADKRGWMWDYCSEMSGIFKNSDLSYEKRLINLPLSKKTRSLTDFMYSARGNGKPVTVHLAPEATETISLSGALYQSANVFEVTLDLGNSKISSAHFLGRDSKVLKIKIIGDFSVCSDYTDFFRRATVEEVDALLDFSSANGAGIFDSVTTLKEARFKENTLSVSLTAIRSALNLSKATVLSLANCLKDGIAGKTLQLHSNAKAICNETMGTVSQITENEVTFNFFTEDEDGDTTLTEFIIDVKGWTLA